MKVKPLHDRVLVKRTEGEEKSAGGIIIPDTAKEKPMEGEILAVGSGVRDEAGKLVGDVQPGGWDVAGHVSPNPGGVGPLTRAFLLTNVVERAEAAAAS